MVARLDRVSATRYECVTVNVLEWILELVNLVQPLRRKHVMGTTTKRHNTSQLASMCVCHTDSVISTRAVRPHDLLLLINTLLLFNPVEQAAPLPVRALGVFRRSRRVTSARDFDNQTCAASAAPALHPYAELGAVAVETGYNNDEWDGFGGGGAFGQVVVDRDCGAFAFNGVFMGDLDFFHGVFAETGGRYVREGLKEVDGGGKCLR